MIWNPSLQWPEYSTKNGLLLDLKTALQKSKKHITFSSG